MQRLANLFAALTLLLGVGMVGFWGYRQNHAHQQADHLHAEVTRLTREVARRAALPETPKNKAGWPLAIDPSWFDQPPRNRLVSPARPWVEIAGAEQSHLTDPTIRAVDERVGAELAEFWYNPANGNVRARVPVGASDRAALRLYNDVNSTSLPSLFEVPMWHSRAER